MRKRRIKITFILLALIIFCIFTLFLVRAFSPKELDDVTPAMNCEKQLLQESSTLWVIPKFENESISENKEWCNYILRLNKTLGLHGVYHEFQEFNTDRNQQYLDEGIKIFQDCFGYRPTMFKPPQLKITKENANLIENNNLILQGEENQILHKVYHCGDYGKKRNWLIDLF